VKVPSFAQVRVWLLCAACLLVLHPPVHAHKVMSFAWIEGERVYVEGYFPDGKKLADSRVEVFDSHGARLAEGRTDDQGVFSFPAPGEGRIRVVITGSMGHASECFVDVPAGIAGDTGGPGNERPAQVDVIDAPGEATEGGWHQVEPGESPGGGQDVDDGMEGIIRSIVSEELDTRLAPLQRELASLRQDRPSVTEILGGIGYVMGIMGLIMYFKARSRRDS
jgi:nickel transport protein